MSNTPNIKVWDALVRFFHWSLVSAFFIAYVTEDDLMSIHSWAGYLIVGLLVVRFLWGFVGTRYARFSDFIYSPQVIIQFLKDTLSGKARRYLGHNPAGGAMIIALMLSLLFTTLSGILVFDIIDPDTFSEFWYEALGGVHELFANLTLLLVIAHVVGVVVESKLHKENLVKSMLNGYKQDISLKSGDDS